MQTVDVRTLKARASELLRAVEEGEVIVVTRRGRPIARLEALGTQTQRQMSLRGLYSHLAPAFDAIDIQEDIRALRAESTVRVEQKAKPAARRAPA